MRRRRVCARRRQPASSPLAAPGADGLVDLFVGRGGSGEPERGPRATLPCRQPGEGSQPDRNGEPIPDVHDGRHTSRQRRPGTGQVTEFQAGHAEQLQDARALDGGQPETQRTTPRIVRTVRSRALVATRIRGRPRQPQHRREWPRSGPVSKVEGLPMSDWPAAIESPAIILARPR